MTALVVGGRKEIALSNASSPLEPKWMPSYHLRVTECTKMVSAEGGCLLCTNIYRTAVLREGRGVFTSSHKHVQWWDTSNIPALTHQCGAGVRVLSRTAHNTADQKARLCRGRAKGNTYRLCLCNIKLCISANKRPVSLSMFASGCFASK